MTMQTTPLWLLLLLFPVLLILLLPDDVSWMVLALTQVSMAVSSVSKLPCIISLWGLDVMVVGSCCCCSFFLLGEDGNGDLTKAF